MTADIGDLEVLKRLEVLEEISPVLFRDVLGNTPRHTGEASINARKLVARQRVGGTRAGGEVEQAGDVLWGALGRRELEAIAQVRALAQRVILRGCKSVFPEGDIVQELLELRSQFQIHHVTGCGNHKICHRLAPRIIGDHDLPGLIDPHVFPA